MVFIFLLRVKYIILINCWNFINYCSFKLMNKTFNVTFTLLKAILLRNSANYQQRLLYRPILYILLYFAYRVICVHPISNRSTIRFDVNIKPNMNKTRTIPLSILVTSTQIYITQIWKTWNNTWLIFHARRTFLNFPVRR